MFQTFIYNPILQTLLFIYTHISFHDLGIAVILLTLLIRIVLFPLFWKTAKDQAAMQKIQPEVERIQKEMKKEPEAQAKAMLALYKEHRVNPFSSILVMVLQLPVFFALFKLFSNAGIYGLFDNPTLFGVINLQDRGFDIALIAAALQYLQFKVTAPSGGGQAGMQKIFAYLIPGVTFLVLIGLPRALGLYWAATALFSIIQQKFVGVGKKKS